MQATEKAILVPPINCYQATTLTSNTIILTIIWQNYYVLLFHTTYQLYWAVLYLWHYVYLVNVFQLVFRSKDLPLRAWLIWLWKMYPTIKCMKHKFYSLNFANFYLQNFQRLSLKVRTISESREVRQWHIKIWSYQLWAPKFDP